MAAIAPLALPSPVAVISLSNQEVAVICRDRSVVIQDLITNARRSFVLSGETDTVRQPEPHMTRKTHVRLHRDP